MNPILKKYQEGKPTIGTFTHLKSAVAVECLAYSGLDYVIIDTEHGPADVEFVSTAITAADAAGITPFVRINEISRPAVLHPLDLGAKGLIVPAVETPEQVCQLIQYGKFAPLGNRGSCPTRDGGWGFAEWASHGFDAYMETANRHTMLIPQCETAGCLAHIEEIAAMDGVDGIFIGPLDLSISLGVPAQFDSPIMQDAIARITAACKKNNKPLFRFFGNPKDAKAYLAEGGDSATINMDVAFLIEAYRSIVNDLRG